MKEIIVPPDKSISHRAILIGSLCKKPLKIKNPLKAGDILSTISCLRSLGIRIDEECGMRNGKWGVNNNEIIVYGKSWKKPEAPLYCGNSGTTMRLLSGILAGLPYEVILTGDSSLSKRPMKRIGEPLSMMGAKFVGDYPPITIEGGDLKAISYKMPISSAQVKSAILLAGLSATGKTSITEPLLSRDHTERMLEFLCVPIKRDGFTISLDGPFEIEGGLEIEIPGDFSSASFFIGASIILNREIKIKNTGINKTRMGFLDCLKKMGAAFTIENERLISNEPIGDIIINPSRLSGIEVSSKDIPMMIDEVPILSILALFAEGTTIIKGASELRAKETDRIKAMILELSKLGARISELPDGMLIEGGYPLKGAGLYSHKDHRIAMALSVLSLKVPGIEIEGREWADISFPNFYEMISWFKEG
ncbi:MAG: 3-phosphoshikimate 1-carboxyvinyltransferase [bacterium]